MLLFSNSTRVLNVVQQLILQRGDNFRRLDGSTANPDRAKAISQFNTQASLTVFLISTAAGGLGVNLTAANKCVPPSCAVLAAAAGLHGGLVPGSKPEELGP